jgi:hypothetical protein
MPTERVQRQIDRLLDEAEEAVRRNEWLIARQRAQAALDLDPDNRMRRRSWPAPTALSPAPARMSNRPL